MQCNHNEQYLFVVQNDELATGIDASSSKKIHARTRLIITGNADAPPPLLKSEKEERRILALHPVRAWQKHPQKNNTRFGCGLSACCTARGTEEQERSHTASSVQGFPQQTPPAGLCEKKK